MSNTKSDEKRVSRRRVVQIAGASVTAPAFVNVATADTQSGHVELSYTATIPTNTSVDVTVYEDTTGDGSADRQQTESLTDGSGTIEYDSLVATTSEGIDLWLMLELSTSDDSVTPSVDSATITLPETVTTPVPGEQETPATDPQGIGELWDNYTAMVAAVVLAFVGIGAGSKSLTVGAWGGYLAFLALAFRSGNQLFQNIGLVTLILVFLGFAFKLVRLEFEGES